MLSRLFPSKIFEDDVNACEIAADQETPRHKDTKAQRNAAQESVIFAAFLCALLFPNRVSVNND
jgi:hypothetical protein